MIRRVPALLLLLALFAGAVAGAPSQPGEWFEQANRLYEQGKFEEAAVLYQKLIDSGSTTSTVHYNLGNALFKSGHLGSAIVQYHLARKVSPRDPDLQANLRFAREQSRGPRIAVPFWQAALGSLSLNEWSLLAAGSFWAVFGLLTLVQWRRTLAGSIRGVLVTLCVAAVLVCSCLAAAWISARPGQIAVVISSQTEARQGPLSESQTVFVAHDGAELRVLDRKDGWLRVTAGAGKTGWVLRTDTVVL